MGISGLKKVIVHKNVENNFWTKIKEGLLFSMVHQALVRKKTSHRVVGSGKPSGISAGLKYDNTNMNILRHCVNVYR